MLISIIGVGLIGVIISIILKNTKPEMAVFCSIATCLLLSSMVLELFVGVITKISTFIASLGVNTEIFSYLIKILGISYIVEFMIDIAEDSGSGAIANKIGLAGKILVASLSLPILFNLIEILMGII